MTLIKSVFVKRGMPVLSTLFIILFIAERKYRLRKRTQPAIKRAITNSLISIPSFTLLRFIFLPVLVWLAHKNEDWKVGIKVTNNTFIQTAVSFLILDYTNFLWHVINHKIPLLWRFHVVHHSDPDLDVTTAFRFHFGEIIGSVFYRGAFVLLSSARPLNVLIYEIVFEGATAFHHSNTRFNTKLESALSNIIVTPRMHGIHHSYYKEETDSNYSVIFSIWDRLHKTFRFNIPQNEITIGVPAYANVEELTVRNLLSIPFKPERPWPKEWEVRKQ